MTIDTALKQIQNHSDKLRTLKLNGHVGFDTLPDQIVSKSVSEGFTFNILCIGETGIGKSTLIDTLFNTKFDWDESTHMEKRVRLNKSLYDLQESNVRLKLSVVETVGFGDQIDKEESHQIISNYLDQQFEVYLQEELKIKRNFAILNDTRIHVCLYFICPTGHSLKSHDLLIMKKLDQKCNIIPIIAKADTIAKNELVKFKQKIMQDLIANQVKIYQFPIDDDSVVEINVGMNVSGFFLIWSFFLFLIFFFNFSLICHLRLLVVRIWLKLEINWLERVNIRGELLLVRCLGVLFVFGMMG